MLRQQSAYGSIAGLTVAGVSAFRGERLVLDNVSFSVESGGALLLLGPNGAGKSTLLRVIAGLCRHEAGRITFGDADDLAGKIGYIGHQDAIKPGLTAAENLAFAAALSGRPVADALAALDLTPLAAFPARMLSAGQKRRLALARLVVSASPVWLLDEPTLGLDAASVTRFGHVLAEHRAQGGIVLAATHLPLPLQAARELVLGSRAINAL
jgi:heme exporter protein A